MGAKGPKGCASVFAIFILALLLSTSSAGGQRRFFDKHEMLVRSPAKGADETPEQLLHEEEEAEAAASFLPRSRILKVNTNDYASYDPSPTLDKPPFKLIPN